MATTKSAQPPRKPHTAKPPQCAPAGVTDWSFHQFVDSVRDHAIFMLDPQGQVTTWNEGAERIKGYRPEEVIGRHVSCFYPREDIEAGLPSRLLAAAEAEGRAGNEGWLVRKDGARFWASVSITAVRDYGGRLQGFGKVVRDLTERKQAEEALRELSGRLIETQDRERRRISLSLTDSTSPSLTALISKLHAAKCRPEAESHQLIDNCVALAEFVSREIRTVSYLLYPPSLETDGLLATLQAHLKGLARQKGIAIEVDFPPHIERLPPAAAGALYRVAQDFLANIFRARENSRAKVRIAVDNGQLLLEVTAEGAGLPPETLEEAKRGVGELGVTMAGMRERIVRLGGSLEIDSTGSGPRVTATLAVNGSRPSELGPPLKQAG